MDLPTFPIDLLLLKEDSRAYERWREPHPARMQLVNTVEFGLRLGLWEAGQAVGGVIAYLGTQYYDRDRTSAAITVYR